MSAYDQLHETERPPEPQRRTAVKLGEKHVRTLWSNARHKVLRGGRGSAKSWSVATYLAIMAAERHKRIVCARQYQNSIRDSSKELIESRIGGLGLEGFSVTDMEIRHKSTGSSLIFMGLDRNIESIRSLEGADVCWVEEARTIKAKSMEVLLPTIRKAHSQIIWTYNPELRTDPVDHYFCSGSTPPNSIVTTVDYRDNPYFYTSDALVYERDTMEKGNPDRYRHVWLGEYDTHYESRVFTNVRVDRLAIPPNTPPVYGLDFGFGSDPSFALRAYVLPGPPRQVYVAAEAFGRVSMDALPSLVRSVVRNDDDRVVADSSQPGTIGFLRARGLNIATARKGPGSVKAGINFLRGHELVISPDCPGMVEESRLYSWQMDVRSGQILNVPVDAHNHGMDALRYATEDNVYDSALDEDDADGGVIKLSLWKPTRGALRGSRQ